MASEYDTKKSRDNLQKHGIDFEDAQALWNDPSCIEVAATNISEARWMITGLIDGVFWTAVVTYRDESTRIISVRRSRKEEKKRYEEKNYH